MEFLFESLSLQLRRVYIRGREDTGLSKRYAPGARSQWSQSRSLILTF